MKVRVRVKFGENVEKFGKAGPMMAQAEEQSERRSARRQNRFGSGCQERRDSRRVVSVPSEQQVRVGIVNG